MFQNMLLDLWPWALALVAVVGALATVARTLRPQIRRGILARLHRDQVGGVQSVSFVLTAPIFVMLMLLAVQITQLMIGLMVVHYAAYATARSATVWLPAPMIPPAIIGANRNGERTLVGRYADGWEYRLAGGTPKHEHIRRAAALACLSIAPSRDLGLAEDDTMTESITMLYAALAPDAMTNARIPQRLANKWAYANKYTEVELRIFHRDDEPPLIWYDYEFLPTEMGWRDQIQATVTHDFALLPGPGRLLARRANESVYSDRVHSRIVGADVYKVPLTATATMVGEGEKSVRAFAYPYPVR